jgi:hypothetical protein
VVLLAAFSSGHSERACARQPTPEGASSHKRGCSCGEHQRHKECTGLAAARIGDDLTAGRGQLAFVRFAYAHSEGAWSSEAPRPAASVKASGSSTDPSSLIADPSSLTAEPSSLTAEPAGSAADHAHTARGTGRSDNP